jgi:dTDP-4-dehydrorhamnose 3,5-epimerase-like enzyme
MVKIKTTIKDCKIIFLNEIRSDMGNLIIVQGNKDIPFDIKRIYYINEVPSKGTRGSHAHKELIQLMIAAQGSFNVLLDDGNNKKTINLTSFGAVYGLLIVPGIWRELINFSSHAVCLVLASQNYNKDDYIRNYDEFLEFKK